MIFYTFRSRPALRKQGLFSPVLKTVFQDISFFPASALIYKTLSAKSALAFVFFYFSLCPAAALSVLSVNEAITTNIFPVNIAQFPAISAIIAVAAKKLVEQFD
jgi:hypothetical protein